MKKMFITLLVLLTLSCTLFVIGWIQFAVPAGSFGVLVTKTGGIDPNPIIPAQFRWQWERLIPTNSEIIVFDLTPITITRESSGILPSAEIYSSMLEGKPDFSWKATIKITCRLKPYMLPGLVEQLSIRTQGNLDAWISTEINRIVAETAGDIIDSAITPNDSSSLNSATSPTLLIDTLSDSLATVASGFDILSVTVEQFKVPDYNLYSIAAKAYESYQEQRTALIGKAVGKEAADSVSEYLQIERFSRWGEVLTKYPILIDFIAVAGEDASGAFKAVRELRDR